MVDREKEWKVLNIKGIPNNLNEIQSFYMNNKIKSTLEMVRIKIAEKSCKE